MILVAEDLLAIISREELDGLTTNLIEMGQPEPVATSIREALGTIGMYIDPFLLKDDALARIWRILAVCWLYNRLSTLPEKREKEQSWAIGVLEAIRDGKFKNLLTSDTATGAGDYGSDPKINI